jgi:hypothetical protein
VVEVMPPGTGGDPTAGSPEPAHPSLTDLAEWDEGLLDVRRAADLAAHLAGCRNCADALADVRAVSRRLAAVPAPAMPPAVAARLDGVLAGEVDRREQRREQRQRLKVVAADGRDGSGQVGWTRPTLGHFGADLPRRSRRRVLVPLLAAAVVAAVVGFGAYVVSASIGLNEPPVVAAVSQQSLGPQAGALAQKQDLDPHRFSRAWQCARQATDGRIVALASSNVDGVPALLVYIRSGATTTVTVVTGCESGRPRAGQSAPVSRR